MVCATTNNKQQTTNNKQQTTQSAIHKKNDFQDATVCLFLFDILYVDGKVVINEPLKKRRQILEVRALALAPHSDRILIP
jgi:ATP-dependent DNA ligase